MKCFSKIILSLMGVSFIISTKIPAFSGVGILLLGILLLVRCLLSKKYDIGNLILAVVILFLGGWLLISNVLKQSPIESSKTTSSISKEKKEEALNEPISLISQPKNNQTKYQKPLPITNPYFPTYS